MTKIKYLAYSQEANITFIMVDTVNQNDAVVSSEVKGFYFGEPNKEDTLQFYGKLKAEF